MILLECVAAVLVMLGIFVVTPVLTVWFADRLVRDSGLTEDERVQVMKEAAGRLALARAWLPW